MSRRQTVIFLALALFLLNFVTALSFINEGLFHCDSVILAQATEKTYATGRLQPAVDCRYGSVIINSILYLPFFLVGQNADFTTRLSSILFHSLSIVALYLFVRELFQDSLQAFFAALLFSFAPFYFVPNTYGKEHGAAMFFVIFSFYLLYRGLNKKSVILISLASFFMAFSISIREAMLIIAPLFFLFYFSAGASIKRLKVTFSKDAFRVDLLVSLLLPFLLVFFLIYFSYLKDVIFRISFVEGKTIFSYFSLIPPKLRLIVMQFFSSIPAPVFVFAFFGALIMAKGKRIFFLMFFLLWLLLSLFFFGHTTCYAPRYLDIIFIPILIFASYVLSGIYTARHRAIVFVIFFYCISGMFIFMYPLLYVRHQYNGEKQFALYVNEKTENNAIIIAMDYAPFIEYYANRKAIGYPIADRARIENFISEINGYLKQGIPVYLEGLSLSYDSMLGGGLLAKALLDNYSLVLIGKKLTEDFHRPEFKFQFYSDSLFKIKPKKRGEDVTG